MIPKRMTITSWNGRMVEVGNYLQTRAGSTYLVVSIRPTRPGSKSVARLDLMKLFTEDIAALPDDAIIHPFQWNSRGR